MYEPRRQGHAATVGTAAGPGAVIGAAKHNEAWIWPSVLSEGRKRERDTMVRLVGNQGDLTTRWRAGISLSVLHRWRDGFIEAEGR